MEKDQELDPQDQVDQKEEWEMETVKEMELAELKRNEDLFDKYWKGKIPKGNTRI